MKILFLLLILTSIFLVTSMMQIAFSQEKFIEFENNNYDIKIEYPQSWNIREGDIEPGDFITEIVILEPQGEFGIHRSDDYNCGDVCIALFIDNTPRESDLAIETYVDQTINSLRDDLDKFEITYYDTTNTKVHDRQAYQAVYEDGNR